MRYDMLGVAAERPTEHCSPDDVDSHVIHDSLVEKTKNPERSQTIGLRQFGKGKEHFKDNLACLRGILRQFGMFDGNCKTVWHV